jgi:hypothetical protein
LPHLEKIFGYFEPSKAVLTLIVTDKLELQTRPDGSQIVYNHAKTYFLFECYMLFNTVAIIAQNNAQIMNKTI